MSWAAFALTIVANWLLTNGNRRAGNVLGIAAAALWLWVNYGIGLWAGMALSAVLVAQSLIGIWRKVS